MEEVRIIPLCARLPFTAFIYLQWEAGRMEEEGRGGGWGEEEVDCMFSFPAQPLCLQAGGGGWEGGGWRRALET